ncbi:HIT family hydrolase [Steroidobacter denitrificans]|uniref:HIT family hydrolase n=1 Tax=Steroidobacter denitrificans TaxID=465721 RepID=A0A127FDS9_STEDE|nr:HIT family protein [Steroidobacter denitrificans]AMN47900.1 HIT family hydrolase [Steroidobacter denitrificans]
MYDDNNVFAKIIRGEIPAFKVHEDPHTLAFMDAMPQSDGHTLVIPKVRARNFFDIEPQALARLIESTQWVARGVRQAFNPGGIRILQFNEAMAGQSVFHIHFHIIPCYEGTELLMHARKPADKALLARQAEQIRQSLAAL